MFDELTKTFKEVYILARERRLDYDQNHPKSFHVGDSIDVTLESYRNPDKNTTNYKLKAHLRGLDFETIKIIQTIMYLGRDNEYAQLPNAEMRYIKLREHFDTSGWNEKDIEIGQMTQKVPLDKYLQNGFEILDIKI